MWFDDIPIKRKLTSVIMLVCSAALIITCSAFMAYELITFRQGLVKNLSVLTQVIADNSTAALAFRSEEDAAQILSALKADPHIVHAALYDENGNLFARHPQTEPSGAFPVAPKNEGPYFEKQHLLYFQPVQAGKRLGALFVRSDLRALSERTRLYTVIALVVLAASLAFAFVLSTSLQKRISEPVLALAAVARTISRDRDYTVRAHVRGRDELGQLTEAFNHMLTQIDLHITENKRVELALRESEEKYRGLSAELESRVQDRTAELASINQELEAFTYSVSHDLRAPLRHINAFAQVLEQDCASELSPEARKYVRRITVGANTMGQLVDDLLNLARVGKQELSRQQICLRDLAGEVVASLKPETDERDIQWRIGPLPSAECDPGLMKQVFVNLLSNAAKYTRPRKTAIIEAGQIEIKGEPILFVRDNGVGFDMQYTGKLFGVFQRLHRAEDFEGTGVGLATVQRIILKHNGRIWADARENEGATFYFTFDGLHKLEPRQTHESTRS